MRIVKLSTDIETAFWQQTKTQIEEYFFFYMDQKYYPEKTQIYLAWEDHHDSSIRGMLLLWQNRIVQVAGDLAILNWFFPYITESVKELSCAASFVKPILTAFPTFKPVFEMYRMVLYRNEFREVSERIETIQHINQISVVQLGSGDLDDIAALMRQSDPEFWGERTSKDISPADENVKWYGIRMDNQLVAIGNYWVGDIIGIVQVIATHPAYRRRGLATIMVYTGIRLIFQRTPCALIHVRKDNVPAIGTYTKLGYHVFQTLQVLRRS